MQMHKGTTSGRRHSSYHNSDGLGDESAGPPAAARIADASPALAVVETPKAQPDLISETASSARIPLSSRRGNTSLSQLRVVVPSRPLSPASTPLLTGPSIRSQAHPASPRTYAPLPRSASTSRRGSLLPLFGDRPPGLLPTPFSAAPTFQPYPAHLYQQSPRMPSPYLYSPGALPRRTSGVAESYFFQPIPPSAAGRASPEGPHSLPRASQIFTTGSPGPGRPSSAHIHAAVRPPTPHSAPWPQAAQMEAKANFLSLFGTFYDALADSRVLARTLEEQVAKSNALLRDLARGRKELERDRENLAALRRELEHGSAQVEPEAVRPVSSEL